MKIPVGLSFLLALWGSGHHYMCALCNGIGRIDDYLIAILKSRRDVELSSQVTPNMDLPHVNNPVIDDRDELSLCSRNHAIAGDKNSGVRRIEMKLHGRKHAGTKTMMGIGNLDLQ